MKVGVHRGYRRRCSVAACGASTAFATWGQLANEGLTSRLMSAAKQLSRKRSYSWETYRVDGDSRSDASSADSQSGAIRYGRKPASMSVPKSDALP
jgi:hypothetical protein